MLVVSTGVLRHAEPTYAVEVSRVIVPDMLVQPTVSTSKDGLTQPLVRAAIVVPATTSGPHPLADGPDTSTVLSSTDSAADELGTSSTPTLSRTGSAADELGTCNAPTLSRTYSAVFPLVAIT